MSDQDDALLDEDLGDEEYDLGNDEEEALLADDYEIDRQNNYKGEEETDDVLDLGVTDALDDLEGEDENIEYRSDTDNHNYNEFYKDERADTHCGYYENQEEHSEAQDINYANHPETNDAADKNSSNTVDLREKLQKNVQRKVFVGNGQGLEDDDCDQAEERRNRFQNERIMISPKMNNDIPDSLENVVTVEQVRQPFIRGRGRGRVMRGMRGGRFAVPAAQGNYIPRFTHNVRTQLNFNEPKPYRPPLIEGRPPIFPRIPSNNMINHHHHHQQQQQQQQQQQHHQQHQPQHQQQHQQHQQQQHQQQPQQRIYQQNNPQIQAYLPNGPPQTAVPRFPEHRPAYNQNQFPGPGIPQGPRMIGPARLDYRPRGPMTSAMPRYSVPQVRNFMQNQSTHFTTPMITGNPRPSLLGNPGLNIVVNQPQSGIRINPQGPIAVNPGISPMRANPVTAMMQNYPRMPAPGQTTIVRSPPGQPSFENRTNFPKSFVDNRAMYEQSRTIYNNQGSSQSSQQVNQINNSGGQGTPHVTNVPIIPGHKILINPHFRGAVQTTNDARLAWDNQQQQPPQQPPQPQHHPPQHQPPPHQPPPHQAPPHQPPQQQPPQHQPASGSTVFPQTPAPYQNQNPYTQAPAPLQQPPSQEYQPNYQPVKSDDPYAYFSDVWSGNKAPKTQTTSKSYPTESTYLRDSSYSNYSTKYTKSESTREHQDSYQEESRSQSYRDRDPPARPRIDNPPRQRVSSNTHHNEPYESRPRQISVSARASARGPIKRSPEPHERAPRQLNPKRVKTMSDRHEFRSVAPTNENAHVKKDEDMDPEMREYRKKMEEQKRLREKILQEKENRRKQAALEMGDESRSDSKSIDSDQQPEVKTAPVAISATKDSANSSQPRGRGRPVNAQATEASGGRIVRAVPIVETTKNAPENEDSTLQTTIGRQTISQSGSRRVVIHKTLPNVQKVATTVQKTVSNLQRPQTIAGASQKGATTSTGILKKVNANRTIVQGAPGSLRGQVKTPKVVVNTQNNQRFVLQHLSAQVKRNDPNKNNIVKIENLAASTSESQIRRMCQGIGTLESIHMGDGNATIVFKTQSAALVFHKKYQRKMLDLSLINVRLVQQQTGNN